MLLLIPSSKVLKTLEVCCSSETTTSQAASSPKNRKEIRDRMWLVVICNTVTSTLLRTRADQFGWRFQNSAVLKYTATGDSIISLHFYIYSLHSFAMR